jgi:hypothetical protein
MQKKIKLQKKDINIDVFFFCGKFSLAYENL